MSKCHHTTLARNFVNAQPSSFLVKILVLRIVAIVTNNNKIVINRKGTTIRPDADVDNVISIFR